MGVNEYASSELYVETDYFYDVSNSSVSMDRGVEH